MIKKTAISKNAEIGATMVEATLALPIFIISVLFLIDLLRYFIVYVLLQYAAYSGADLATKLETELDTYSTSCPNPPCNCDSNPADCTRYEQIAQRVTSQTEAIARLMAHASNETGASVRLVQFDHFISGDFTWEDGGGGQYAGSGLSPFSADSAVLRPGERVQAQPSGEFFENTIRPWNRGSGCSDCNSPPACPACKWPARGETWGSVLQNVPIEVRVHAIMRPITPFIPEMTIVGRSFGYRAARRGAGDVNIPSTSTYTPTPTSTTTLTPLPTNTPATPTSTVPSPTPTNTGSPTATVPSPTPTWTFTPTPTSTGPTATPTVPKPSPTASATGSATATATPVTPTATATPVTPTPTATTDPACQPGGYCTHEENWCDYPCILNCHTNCDTGGGG